MENTLIFNQVVMYIIPKNFPWLKTGRPSGETYKQFEEQLSKAFSKIKNRAHEKT